MRLKYAQTIGTMWIKRKEDVESNERLLKEGKVHPVILKSVEEETRETKSCLPTLKYLYRLTTPWWETDGQTSISKEEKINSLHYMLAISQKILKDLQEICARMKIEKDTSEDQKNAILSYRGARKLVKKEVDCLLYFLDLVEQNKL